MSVRPSPAGEPPPRQILALLVLGATVLSWTAMVAKPEAAVEIGAAWGATCTLLGAMALAHHPRE